MAKNISIEITTSNLGPHEALVSKLQTSSLEIGIYANNGSGKTFLSRAFRLLTKKDLQIEDSNKLLTIGRNDGFFQLKIVNSKEPGKVRELDLVIGRNSIPVITRNTTDYLFRVFNEDYIKENLEGLKYRPDGQIEGYILGKEKIDLSNEKRLLAEARLEYINKEKELKTNVGTAVKQLDELSIRKNTVEYQNVNYNNLFIPEFIVTETETFNDLLKKHNQLKSIPDSLADLINTEKLKLTDTLSSINSFLKEIFSRSSIAEDFKQKVKNKQDFIQAGINLFDKENRICPFCEQILGEESMHLIDHYLEYLSETEAQQIKKSNDLFAQLKSERKDYGDIYKTFVKLHNDYLKNQKFIPSLSDKHLVEIKEIKELDPYYKIIQNALEKKKEDITALIMSKEIDEAIIAINSWVTNTNLIIQSNEIIIQAFNNRKNNINVERLDLNRRLCKSRFIELKKTEDSLIKKISEIIFSIEQLENEILQKEQSEKISKKIKVVETFKSLLSKFFGGKYSFDDMTFCLKFKNHLLETNASDVLSSGEKSIVAFCYYIAESHKFIEKEEDYEKLFFIIDDPISSQDFHFVYATSQIIRTLNGLFKIPRLRLILLTHNLEFMSIIIRNKIIDQKFILADAKVENLGNELIMPYEQHLRDIYQISQGTKSPCHTTPNSLRHILETINRFIAPDTELNLFCEKIDGYAENEFLYSLMHDGSHGGIRLQKAYTDQMIKTACEIVINYISKDFSGQINLIVT
jgi:hypothetical protein